MNKKRSELVGLVAIGMAALIAGADTVYQNDFATRTSAGAVPYGGWRSVNYIAGQLLANTNYVSGRQFDDGDLQDNWIKAQNTCRSNAYVDDDNGNYMARLGDDSTKATEATKTGGERITGGHVIIRQRIGNTFTNGIVTVTFDMLPPSSWWYYSGHPDDANHSRCARLHLGNENAYTSTPTSTNTMLRIGASFYNSNRRVYQQDGNGVSYSEETFVSGHWLRYVVTVDMDERKWGYSCYDLGTAHPAIETTPQSAPFRTASNLDFAPTDKPVTSISTISIDGYAVLDGTSAAYFDNIRIAHNGTECYENDFNTRKSRSLAESLTSTAYSAQSALFDSFQYENTNNVLDVDGNISTSVSGYDGWKRRNSGGKGALVINGTTHYMYFNISSSGYAYGRAAHPIGINATNGTIRFRGDIRTPTKWWSSNRFVYLSLGDDVFYEDKNNTFNDHEFTRVGVTSNGSGNNPGTLTNIYYYANGGTQTKAADVPIEKETFYRIVITAHLDGDSKTYDYEMYRQSGNSDTANNGTLISSGYGLTPRAGVSSISSFGISAYGTTDARFDNFRVWYTPSGSSEEYLVYQNSLDTRRIYRHEGSMIGTLKSEPVGMDGWTRLGTSTKNVMLSSDGNAALMFGDGDETYATAVHDLGGVYGSGTMIAQADICAPTSWQESGGCANIWFGNDQYHEGNLNGGAYNYEKMAAFGFGITNTTFASFEGDRAGGGTWETSGTATAGHWYRFVVSAKGRISDVAVYDMGTEQPTLATETSGTPVAEFSALPFRAGVRGGVSCVGVSAMGVKNPTVWSHLLPGGTDARLKIDNIRVGFREQGTVLKVR